MLLWGNIFLYKNEHTSRKADVYLSVRGPPLDMGGGDFCQVVFIDFTREIESFKYLFSPQDRLERFIPIFILYLFQPPLWSKYF